MIPPSVAAELLKRRGRDPAYRGFIGRLAADGALPLDWTETKPIVVTPSIRLTPRPICRHEGDVVNPCPRGDDYHIRSCDKWTTCSRLPRGGYRSCTDCGDYEVDRTLGPKVTAGVVIGTYGWPRLAEVQIRTIREMTGDSTPILIADDGSPATADLARLCERYQGVEFAGSLHRTGHYAGDLSVFRKGVEWGMRLNLAAVVKLSMRCLIVRPGWLDDVANLVVGGSAETVVPRLSEGRDRTLFFRTEAVAMRIEAWSRPDVMARLTDEDLGGRGRPTELRFNDIIHRQFGGRAIHWPGWSHDRYQRTDGVIWHCTNPPSEYVEWAARYGLEIDDGFHTDGHNKRAGWKA